MLNKLLTIAICALAALPLSATAAQADEGATKLDCADPVNSGRRVVKNTIGPMYLNGANDSQLKTAATSIDAFVTGATYCQMELQSRPERVSGELIAEWRSLNQWLHRLADTLSFTLTDPLDLRWRNEYTLFAEIYEFEP
ncbi:MAG: hypothetical protein ACU84Q_16335 [Gammaproteobacteria bacterium]